MSELDGDEVDGENFPPMTIASGALAGGKFDLSPGEINPILASYGRRLKGWEDENERGFEYNPPVGLERITINIGITPVVEINKLYGPWCANSIRARLDFDTGQWVIEVERLNNDERSWVEAARFEAYIPDPAYISE